MPTYHLQITKPGGEVELLPLDPHKGIINIGRDSQNDLVIDDPAAELFHAFLDYRQSPPRFVILGSETGDGPNASQIDTLKLADYTLTVVESVDVPAEAVLPTATPAVNTTPFYDFSIGKLQPKRQTMSWSKSFATFTVSIANMGNRPATFHLRGLDEESACRFEFEPPDGSVGVAGQVDFQLPPDTEASIPIRVTPSHKPLVSLSRQKYHLTITATVPQSGQLPRSMLGEVSVKPLVGPGMLAMVAVVLLMFGILAIGPLAKTGIFSPTPVVANRVNGSDEVTIFPFTRAQDSQTLPELVEAETAAVPTNYEEMFMEIGPKYNLDWRLLEALAYRESGMNFLAVGRSGDMGLMQIIPSTWGQWAPKVEAKDPFDPYSNILVGAAFLANMREFCTQRGYTDPRWMLVAYNWGPNRLGNFWNEGGTWGDIPATQRNYASGIVQKSIDRAATTASFEELYPNVVQGQ